MVEHLLPKTLSRPNLTEAALCAWVGQAFPGEQLIYYRGFLAIDIGPDSSALTPAARQQLRRLADRAYRLFEQRLVHLVQRREALGEYTYMIVARTRPKHGGATGALREILDRVGLSETKQSAERSA